MKKNYQKAIMGLQQPTLINGMTRLFLILRLTFTVVRGLQTKEGTLAEEFILVNVWDHHNHHLLQGLVYYFLPEIIFPSR